MRVGGSTTSGFDMCCGEGGFEKRGVGVVGGLRPSTSTSQQLEHFQWRALIPSERLQLRFASIFSIPRHATIASVATWLLASIYPGSAIFLRSYW